MVGTSSLQLMGTWKARIPVIVLVALAGAGVWVFMSFFLDGGINWRERS
jgi:hypothetical protein